MNSDAICAICKQIVEIDPSGNLVPHYRQHSPFQCYASGMPAHEALLNGQAQALALQPTPPRRAKRFKAPPPPPPLKPPVWLPSWDGEHLPSIALPKEGPVGIWFPRGTSWEQEKRIIEYLPTRLGPEWDAQRGCWTVSNRHFLRLANQLLARNARVAVGRQYNPREKCTSSCKNAKLPICTCSCRGKNHGRGRWMAGWKILHEIDTRYQGQSWHWFVAKLTR